MQGTTVIANYWGANMDESVWSDPQEFKPERFLNDKGEFINAEKILSFAIGKATISVHPYSHVLNLYPLSLYPVGPRNCIGEAVAKSSLMNTLSWLIQQFRFEVDPDSGMPNNENADKLSISPTPFKVLVRSGI